MAENSNSFASLTRFSPTVGIVVLVLSLGACVFGLLGWKTWDAREATFARSADSTQNLAHSLAQHASRTFETVDIVLAGVVERLQHDGYGPEQSARLNSLLATRARALSQIREIAFLDAKGAWQFSSLPSLPAYSNADRDYFVYHRDHSDLGLRINRPLVSRVSGRWTILLTRRVQDPDGSFAGVALAAVDLDYFQHLYDSFQIGQEGTIGLFRNDDTLLVRRPFAVNNIGENFSGLALFRDQVNAAPTGYYRMASPFDGLDKWIAYARLSDYPIVVTVALAEREILAPWRETSRTDLIVAAVIWIVVALMGAFIATQVRLRARDEKILRESETRYRLLADHAGDVVIRLRLDGVRQYVSPAIFDMLGWRPEELIGSRAFHLAHPGHLDDLERLLKKMGAGKEHARMSYQFRRKDGVYVWVETSFNLVRDKGTRLPSEIIAVMRDVSLRKAAEEELQEANARLQAQAATDALTDLPNRRSFDAGLERECRRAARGKEPLSVLFIDIDRFKSYNDAYGHPAGDACLRNVAQAVMQAVGRPGDLAARYGGEEFAVILPETDERGAGTIAERLRRTVQDLAIMHRANPSGCVTVSIGTATATLRTQVEGAALVRAADKALYEAKRFGRNRVVASFASQSSDARVA